jgi:signal transduction histidine kinase/ActR/RegA family two-component response regulator
VTVLGAELEHLPVGLLQLDRDGRVLAANHCVADWLGCTPAQLAGTALDSVLSRAGQVVYHTHLLPMLNLGRTVQELTLELRSPAGLVQVLACASRLPPPDERMQLVLTPMRERLRLETALLRVQRSADAAPLLLFEYVREADGRASMPYASAGLVSLYDLSPEALEFSDLPWLARVHGDDVAALIAARDASARRLGIWQARYRVRAAGNGWHWHQLRAQPYAEPDQRTVWHGMVTDVTQQLAVEQAERERDAAERASRSKSEFLARMSHELRTPLNAIIGFSQLLSEEPAIAAAGAQPRLEVIHNAGQLLLRLIDDVLDIARIEAGRLRIDMRSLPLMSLLRRVVQGLEPAMASRQIRLALHTDLPDAQALLVQADEGRLHQVLNNLLSNAVKYNRPRGWIRLTVHAADGQVRVAVQDDGPGLSEAQRSQLFQPFNRLGAEYSPTEGTGLGLVISRSLAESMGGSLDLASPEGRGCCFVLRLRQAHDSGPALPPPQPPAASAPTRPQPGHVDVLYVEDDPVNVLLMESILMRRPGLALRVARNGAEARQAAQVRVPDLLLLDMHLPDTDGMQLLFQLRTCAGAERVPAVAVSADAMPQDIALAMSCGFDAYWTKPLNVVRLLNDLDAVLLRGHPLKPPTAQP